MTIPYKKYCKFDHHLIILGFGGVGQALLPLIFRHMDISPQQITIMSNDVLALEQTTVQEYGVRYQRCQITSENYRAILGKYVAENDFLLNVSVDISSRDVIQFCHERNALYLDTSLETWPEEENEPALSQQRTNYALRENVLAIGRRGDSTAIITHGANPGLISHFVKQALCNLAADDALDFKFSGAASDWAKLACQLNIKTMQIAEFDSQVSSRPKQHDEFVNTWSVEGFIIESLQPAELGWGTHERHWPVDGKEHTMGSRSAIYLDKPSAGVRVRTWTPLAGAFEGFLITHMESIALAEYFSLQEAGKTIYRPTVHYAYSPCPDAILSLQELIQRNLVKQPNQRLIVNDITSGIDELGILLLGHSKGVYWFGSQLSIEEARQLAPHNNATTLQVAAGVLAAMIWGIHNPRQGIVEPEAIDHAFILKIARPYLGTLAGYYGDWTPLQNTDSDAASEMDVTDPWQFKNLRVAQ